MSSKLSLYVQDISRKITEACENYVKFYWIRRSGEKYADETTAFDDLLPWMKEEKEKEKEKEKSKITKLLDGVVKTNMSQYYNMLLPKTVSQLYAHCL